MPGIDNSNKVTGNLNSACVENDDTQLCNTHEKRFKIASVIGLALIFVALYFYAPKAVKESYRADFERYYTAGCAALSGGDIYRHTDDRQFKYFPFFAQCMAPLAFISEAIVSGKFSTTITPTEEGLRTGATIWYAILCASYLGSIFLAVSLCNCRLWQQRFFATLVAIAASARIFNGNVRNGQINMVVMFLAVFGCWLFAKKFCRLGGTVIGAAAAIKYMPILLTIIFIRRKAWGALASCLLFIVLAVYVIPAATWGLHGNIKMFHNYLDRREKMVTDLPKDQAPGQSLPSLANRLLTNVNAAPLRWEDKNGQRRTIFINITHLPFLAKIAAIVLVMIAVIVVFLNISTKTDGVPQRFALEVGLIFLLMLMVSPEARKAQYITILIPVTATAAACMDMKTRLGRKMALGIAVVLLGALGRDLVGSEMVYHYLNAYGVMLWGGVLLAMVTLAFLRRQNES